MIASRTKIVRRGLGCVLGLVFALLLIAAANGTLPSNLAALGWEEIVFEGKEPNRYARCGENCIRIETRSSVSMIGRPVAIDLSKRPVLTWEWKTEKPVPLSDLTVKGQDDRAIALYVAFPYDPETATFSERLLRPLVEVLRGDDTPGRALSYVWGGHGEPGDFYKSPYQRDSGTMIICRTRHDPVGEWISERRDVAADYERAFGTRAETVSHILLGADSDDVGTETLASIRNIDFVTR